MYLDTMMALRMGGATVERLVLLSTMSVVSFALTQGQWKAVLREAGVNLSSGDSTSILTALNNALEILDDKSAAPVVAAAATPSLTTTEEALEAGAGGGDAKLAAQKLLYAATDAAWGEVAAMINPSNIMFAVGSVLLLIAYAVLVGSKVDKARSSNAAENRSASVTIMAYTTFFMGCFEAMGSSMIRREHSQLVGGMLLLVPPLMAAVFMFNFWSALFGLTSEKLDHWAQTVVSELVSWIADQSSFTPNEAIQTTERASASLALTIKITN